jgi:hypothetical protein
MPRRGLEHPLPNPVIARSTHAQTIPRIGQPMPGKPLHRQTHALTKHRQLRPRPAPANSHPVHDMDSPEHAQTSKCQEMSMPSQAHDPASKPMPGISHTNPVEPRPRPFQGCPTKPMSSPAHAKLSAQPRPCPGWHFPRPGHVQPRPWPDQPIQESAHAQAS